MVASHDRRVSDGVPETLSHGIRNLRVQHVRERGAEHAVTFPGLRRCACPAHWFGPPALGLGLALLSLAPLDPVEFHGHVHLSVAVQAPRVKMRLATGARPHGLGTSSPHVKSVVAPLDLGILAHYFLPRKINTDRQSRARASRRNGRSASGEWWSSRRPLERVDPDPLTNMGASAIDGVVEGKEGCSEKLL
jgi:hypothetical protein